MSVCVQALPSLQAVPFGLLGLVHRPVAGVQVPATWHWSSAAHTTGLPNTQAPAWQVSVCVQALPSLQLAFATQPKQVPVDVRHCWPAEQFAFVVQLAGAGFSHPVPEQASVPGPPLTVSPLPASTKSSPSPAVMTSLLAPPSMTSLPVPPPIVSTPPRPAI